jgi:hypothetical protein
MDPVTATPTEPLDYATLTAAYGALLGALVLAAASGRTEDPPRGAELIPIGAATFTLSKAIAHEKVETWLREPFVEERPDGEKRPRGSGLRYAVGELLSCTRCLGVWSALGLVALRTASPPAGRTVTAVLAGSAANDFLQAGFRWVCTRSEQVAG